MKKVALYLSGIGTGGIESVTISQFLYMDKSNIEVEFLVDSSPSHNFNVEKIKQGNGIIGLALIISNLQDSANSYDHLHSSKPFETTNMM